MRQRTPQNLARTNCQDVCDQATAPVPSLETTPGDPHAHALNAAAAMTVLTMPAMAAVQLPAPRQAGMQSLSTPITFLRLARWRLALAGGRFDHA